MEGKTIFELVSDGFAEDLGEVKDAEGNRWKKVRMLSGAVIQEMVYDQSMADHNAKREARIAAQKTALKAQNAEDKAKIEASDLSKDVKDILLRRVIV